MQIRPIMNAPLGVEVIGKRLQDATDVEVALMMGAMQVRGGVLVVRGQSLTPPETEAAMKLFQPYFGEPKRYDRWPGQSPQVDGCPCLATLGNYRARVDNEFGIKCNKGDPIAEFKVALKKIEEWHTDGSFLDSPKVAIALYAPDIDDALPLVGGETGFASCTAAWNNLPAKRKEELQRLASVHSWEKFMRLLEARDPAREKVTQQDIDKHPDVTWPMVRLHKPTGLPCIYVNPKNTKGVVSLGTEEAGPNLTEAEAVEFVEEVVRSALNEKYLHKWQRGDFVIWDNRVLLHAAHPFDNNKFQRLLFRMEFSGEPVEAWSVASSED